jgi:hypothetical protein
VESCVHIFELGAAQALQRRLGLPTWLLPVFRLHRHDLVVDVLCHHAPLQLLRVHLLPDAVLDRKVQLSVRLQRGVRVSLPAVAHSQASGLRSARLPTGQLHADRDAHGGRLLSLHHILPALPDPILHHHQNLSPLQP